MIRLPFSVRSHPVSPLGAKDRRPLGDGYDVVVIGGGAFACAVAGACAATGAAVALLAPGAIEASAAERAWPVARCSDPDPRRVAIQRDAPQRIAKLARRLRPSPRPERTGCLAVADHDAAMAALRAEGDRAKALGVAAWMVPAREVAALAPPLAQTAGLAAGLIESGAVTLNADAFALGLAQAAEASGVAVHADTRVEALSRDGAAVIGVEVDGRFIRAGAVVLADDASAIRLVREGRGRLSLKREERMALVTQGGAPAIGPALVIDDVLIARDLTGAVLISGAYGGDALARRALDLAPELGRLEVVSEEPVTIWTGVDGRAQVGPAEIDGLWLALGFGRDALSPALAAADYLADALSGQRTDPAFEPFAPTRRASARLTEAAR